MQNTGYKHTDEAKEKMSKDQKENGGHSLGHKKGKSSIYRGITYNKIRKKWIAQITIDGNNIKICAHVTEIEAAKQYDLYLIEHNINRPKNFENEEIVNELSKMSGN